MKLIQKTKVEGKKKKGRSRAKDKRLTNDHNIGEGKK